MRITSLILFSLLLGIAIGVGSAAWRLHSSSWDGSPTLSALPARPALPGPGEGVPQVVVDREDYRFGVMDATEQRSHDFLFTNHGNGPLTLKAGSTSCRCALSSLEKDSLEPGESAKVTVRFKASETTGPYRQTVLIYTNDPERPEITLSINGEVTVPVRVEPAELVLTRVPSRFGASGEVRLLCNLPGKALEIPDFVCADRETARFFDVKFQPLTAEQIASNRQVRSGVLMQVTVKPGLPQGRFQQTMLLRTNLEVAPALTVPVKGNVEGDISAAGVGWDAEQGILTFGTVSSQTGAERRLVLIVRGKYGREVHFKPLQITPAFLEATLGPTTAIGGEATQTPLVIQVPKNSPPVNHLGSAQGELGKIVLETKHPDFPQFTILLRLAIER